MSKNFTRREALGLLSGAGLAVATASLWSSLKREESWYSDGE